VNAEDASDVAEQFDINVVPTFVFIRVSRRGRDVVAGAPSP
jgi:predicted DsbA family dithiol-disulfide isomerase